MKQITELLPLILFVIAYKYAGAEIDIAGWQYTMDGIYSATMVLMLASILQVLFCGVVYRQVEKRQWWLLATILTFGGATVILRNELFIMWKPTIFNWVMAAVFIFAPRFTAGQTLMEKAIGDQIPAPKETWKKLNLLWVSNFIFVGGLNLYVAYNFSQAFWVSYKLYSAIGFSLLLSVITIVLVSPHIKDSDSLDSSNK